MLLYIDTTLTVFCTFMFFKRKKKQKSLSVASNPPKYRPFNAFLMSY